MTDVSIIWQILLGSFGVVAGAASVYLYVPKVIQAALNREAKGMVIKQVLDQMGLKNVKIKDFNDLSDQGTMRLIAVLREVRGPGAIGGPAATGILGEIQQLQQLAAAFPQTMAGKTQQQANPFEPINPNPNPGAK